MERQHANIVATVLAACLFACGALGGCAGPSTRVLPRDVGSDQPYEVPEEGQVLEEVNPFYLQESLNYLSGFVRESGTPGEGAAAEYIRRLFVDYGYETRVQGFSVGDAADGTLVQGQNVIGSKKAPSPDGDILIIAASHDSMPDSPGANKNASGTVVLLECARLLSRLSTDTELRFVSFAGSMEGSAGAACYADSLTETERHRVIGAIQLDTLGYVADYRVELGTVDGKQTLMGDMLNQVSKDVLGLTSSWQYTLRAEGDHVPFVRGEIPAVTVSQAREAYECGTPQDRAEVVNVELLAGVVDVVSHTAAWIMSGNTPSQLAKSRFMNNMQENAWTLRRDIRFPFGESHERADAMIGAVGTLVSSNLDGAGRQVDTYQYRMKWFDVDQIILTNYHYSDGKLETISLDADGAGVEFAEMRERIGSWYGEPSGESSGPAGTEYGWTDPLYHKFIALIPASDGFDVEIRDYTPEKTVIGTYLPDGTAIGQSSTDSRIAKLLKLVQDILPGGYYGWISQIAIYTDGVGDTDGYLEAPEDDAEDETELRQAVLWVDLEDALSESGEWRNQTATVRMLTESCGQILELNAEADYRAAYQEQFFKETAAIVGDDLTEPEEDAAGTDGGDEESGSDFAEAFMRFVLFQKPAEVRDISDGQIQFFYNYRELVTIRTWIRDNLQLRDEAQAKMLSPEGGALPPGP